MKLFEIYDNYFKELTEEERRFISGTDIHNQEDFGEFDSLEEFKQFVQEMREVE